MSELTVLDRIGPDLYRYPDRQVGIEIEMEGDNLHLNPLSYWIEHFDGSLRGDGVEWVLKVPAKRSIVQSRLNYLARKLKDQGSVCEPSDRCGVHVHINCQSLSLEELYAFIVLYYIFEDVLLHYCGDARKSNLFCLSGTDAEYVIRTIINCRANDTLQVKRDTCRYSALNFEALRKFGSLEFRALETPADVREIGVWVKILLAIFDASKQFKALEDIPNALSAGGAMQFFNHVLGEFRELFKLPDEEIEYMMYNGIRLIQDLCYTPAGIKGPEEEDEEPEDEDDMDEIDEMLRRRVEVDAHVAPPEAQPEVIKRRAGLQQQWVQPMADLDWNNHE